MTNRVAGFICKYVFSEHESCVTSLVVMGRNDDLDSTYVVWAFAILCGSKQRIKLLRMSYRYEKITLFHSIILSSISHII